jgi:hypothetical protein
MATHRRQELRRAARTLAAAARELALPAGEAGALHEAA